MQGFERYRLEYIYGLMSKRILYKNGNIVSRLIFKLKNLLFRSNMASDGKTSTLTNRH